jgi:alkanesulfonate monooxygenase SsuD/methylene tetrahydromethanopterin reductase-like flavin-dependent oxidoreductase (luciferase family)
MARHPWVAEADRGVRFGVQLVVGPADLPRLPETGRLVERLGFDGLFVFDHPSTNPDPWTCLAALAAVTERVRLGSVVNCVAYRHPVHLARLAADLDVLSGGRLVLGLGIGWFPSEFRALGLPMPPVPARHAALEEAVRIVEGVWGAEPFSFAGEHYRVEAVRVEPPPVQRPRPPLLIGGSGERVTLRQVARFADACNVGETEDRGDGPGIFDGLATLRRRLAALDRHCAEVGRPPEEVLRTHFTLRLVLAPTERAVAAKLAAVLAVPSASPGTRRALPSATIAGTPEQIAAHYRARVAAGIQYFVVQVDAGDTETLELLGREVMPQVG